MVTNPTFLRVPDPSDGTGQLTQHPSVALDQTVAHWLREGAPRVNSRSNPNSAFHPCGALLVFRWRHQPPPVQSTHRPAPRQSLSSSHVRAAAQEFTRTEGAQKFFYTRLHTEAIDCCRIYHLPPPPSPGSLPSPTGAFASTEHFWPHARSRP